MAGLFRSFTSSIATATLIFFGVAAMPAPAQPVLPTIPSAAPKPKTYPEVQEAINQLLKDRKLENLPRILKDNGALRKYPELPSAHLIQYQILVQMKNPTAHLM